MAKILVIDDSQMMRLYLKRCLEQAGFQVEAWLPLSAMEIAARIQESAPDLVLTDFQMPGCNGATVARMVFKADPGIPLLVLTAFRDAEMEAGLAKFGVKEILAKPIQADRLVASVRRALGNSTKGLANLAGSPNL